MANGPCRRVLLIIQLSHYLMAATGEDNADDALAVIVKAFWESLRGELPKVH